MRVVAYTLRRYAGGSYQRIAKRFKVTLVPVRRAAESADFPAAYKAKANLSSPYSPPEKRRIRCFLRATPENCHMPFRSFGEQISIRASKATIQRVMQSMGYRCCVAMRIHFQSLRGWAEPPGPSPEVLPRLAAIEHSVARQKTREKQKAERKSGIERQ
jgi:hypothetical protein